MEKDSPPGFVTVGEILAPWGVKGKLRVRPLTDFPKRFSPGAVVFIDGKIFTVEEASPHKGALLVKLKGIDTFEKAEVLSGKEIEIREENAHPLPEGSYYYFQLVGLTVVTTKGETLGRVSELLTAPGCDNLVVKTGEREILIPAVSDIIRSVDLEKGTVTIEAIPGLLELNEDRPGQAGG